MNLAVLAKRAEKAITDNSPVILTAIGVTGVLATAYFTGKASAKAAAILAEEEQKIQDMERDVFNKWMEGRDSEHLTGREKFEKLYKLYIPPVVTGTLTIAAIVGSNHIGSRRAAALASAVNISERAFNEYRTKAVEKLGEKQELDIRKAVAQDRTDKAASSNATVITTSESEQLCLDAYSNQLFTSSMNALQKAENEIFTLVRSQEHATLSDFYDLVGIPTTSVSGMVGWNHDHPLKLDITATIHNDKPVLNIDFERIPVPDPHRFRSGG